MKTILYVFVSIVFVFLLWNVCWAEKPIPKGKLSYGSMDGLKYYDQNYDPEMLKRIFNNPKRDPFQITNKALEIMQKRKR